MHVIGFPKLLGQIYSSQEAGRGRKKPLFSPFTDTCRINAAATRLPTLGMLMLRASGLDACGEHI